MKKDHNPFGNPYHVWPPEVLQAHVDKPLWNGHIAPFDESSRQRWRDWAKKWKERGVPLWPAMVDAYKDLDRKSMSKVSTNVNR
jgi:hypothetical protein